MLTFAIRAVLFDATSSTSLQSKTVANSKKQLFAYCLGR